MEGASRRPPAGSTRALHQRLRSSKRLVPLGADGIPAASQRHNRQASGGPPTDARDPPTGLPGHDPGIAITPKYGRCAPEVACWYNQWPSHRRGLTRHPGRGPAAAPPPLPRNRRNPNGTEGHCRQRTSTGTASGMVGQATVIVTRPTGVILVPPTATGTPDRAAIR